MKCSQAQKMINDHIDNLLGHREVKKLEAHLEKCEACRNLLIDMKALVSKARQLEAVEPSEASWLSIKKELIGKDRKVIAQHKERGLFFNFFPNPQRLAIAAGIFLGIFSLTFLFYYGLPFIKNGTDDPTKYALIHFKEAEQHYQIAIAALNRTMPDQYAKLPPDLAAVFKKNMTIIDDSIRVCQTAIKKHPENQEANAHLMICYKKKIELLNEIRNMAMEAS
jgi:hypothetical protein